MSMNVSSGDKQGVMCDINTTPLIDVMLVLLVTLIMSLPIQTHAVKLDMPPPNPNQPPPTEIPEVINLEVDFDDSIYWNGATVPDRDALISKVLVEAVKVPQPEVHIRGDAGVRFEAIGRVLFAVQRGGIVKIGFLTEADRGMAR